MILSYLAALLLTRHEQAMTIARLARERDYDRSELLDLIVCLREDLAEMAQREAGWRRRCEALADVVDPELVQGIFGVLTTIEGLPSAEVR